MPTEEGTQVDKLVQAVQARNKYGQIAETLVRWVAADELIKGRPWKQTVRAVKRRLHQVATGYLKGRPDYGVWLAEMAAAAKSTQREELPEVCMRAMTHHSSTAERLPILRRFYAETLGGLPPIRTLIDVACGLNPLGIPWMPLEPGTEYYAYDVLPEMVSFLQRAMPMLGVKGTARVLDLTSELPRLRVDVALLLKTLPCLAHLRSDLPTRLLDSLNANHVVVSFPVSTLSGRAKGMLRTYEERFREWTAGRRWSVRRVQFDSELAFVVSK